jgi:hypothetical protein
MRHVCSGRDRRGTLHLPAGTRGWHLPSASAGGREGKEGEGLSQVLVHARRREGEAEMRHVHVRSGRDRRRPLHRPSPAEGICPSTPVAEAKGKNKEGFRPAGCASAVVHARSRRFQVWSYGSIRSISNFSFLHRPPRRIAGDKINCRICFTKICLHRSWAHRDTVEGKKKEEGLIGAACASVHVQAGRQARR